MTFPDSEPAVTAGTLTALVAAVVALLVAFGAQITDDQREAILAVVAVVAPIVAALLIRPNAWPKAKIDAVPAAKAALEQAEVK